MHTCEIASPVRSLGEPPARLEAHNVALLSNVRTGPQWSAAIRFAIEQRLFGLGFGRAGAARAWYRRYEWTQIRRQLGTMGAMRALVKRPARIARESWRAAAKHGPAVRDLHGTPPVWAQGFQMLWLGLRHGLDPESYYRFWLFKGERRGRAHKYIQQHEAGLLYRVLAVRDAMDDFRVTEDKRLFERWCGTHSIPCVPTVAEFDDGVLVPTTPFVALPGRDLFSKPVDSFGGAGAQRWRYSSGVWFGNDGQSYDRSTLLDALAAQSRGRAIMLQVCLENDPRLAHLTSGALCTVRIVTIRPPDGNPELACAVYRMATGTYSTDNFSRAGLAASVNLEKGRLGPAVRSDPRLVIAPVARHPDTRALIEGTSLPWWHEARALALAAHTKLRAMACVGWDLALTSAGPVLVEANWAPGARLAQAPSGVPLGETNFMRYLDAHLRRSFAQAK